MNNAAAMMNMKKWISGALLAAAVAGCSTAGDGDNGNGDRADNTDIQSALAALPEASVLLYSPDGVVPQYIVGDLGKISAAQDAGLVASDTNLRAALPPILKAFRLENKDLFLRKVNVDEFGARHYRYYQKFNGLDVVGGDLAVHVDVKGGIFSINGTARGDVPPTLGASSVTESAANAAIAADARWAGLQGRAVTGSRMVYLQSQDGSLHKAYEQIVEGIRGQDPVKDRVYVDADSGAVIETHPMIHHALNRQVYNLNHATSGGTLARSEGQAATSDLDVNGAYDGTGATYMLYKNFFNRDSFDNAGATLHSDVHYSSNYCNAFWDGSRMAYGDGNSSQNCGPLARSVDVTGHELTHAVTERESNLTYSGESGGLNESMSDIFGNSTEAWVAGGSTGTTLSVSSNTFLVGETVIPPYLRNMCDPAADGSSADVWSTSTASLDPHYSSGPNNLVFCLLVKGGSHPRQKTTTVVPAIGIDKTIRLFYNSNVNILTSNATYASIRAAMESSATALGYDQATKDAVGCAYAAIKVGTAPASCGGTPPPPDGVLTNGVPVTGISDSTGGWKYWTLDVPSSQSTLTFTISGGSGDADLYVNFGSQPSSTVYQCRPYVSGNSETCTFTPPSAGKYYVGLNAYAAYSSVTLTGTYSAGGTQCGGDPVLTNGTTVGNLSGATGANAYWCLPAVPSGKTLTVKISGGTGDADLYTRFGSRPTTSTYNCRPYLTGNAETCTATTTSTTAGDWYVMLRGYAAYSGVSLIGSY
jgi:vibriolysin